MERGAEILRLGCDRQEYCILEDGRALLKAVHPPYYNLMQALEERNDVDVFLPEPGGRELIWTVFGWRHPFVRELTPPESQLLLIDHEGNWETLENINWTSIYDMLRLELSPDISSPIKPDTKIPEETIPVTLRLVAHAREAGPAVWVAQAGGEHEQLLENLVSRLPEEQLRHIEFSVCTEPPLILLKKRQGHKNSMLLDLPGEPCAVFRDIPNLYLPADSVFSPPLRRETLQQLLTGAPQELTCVYPDGKNSWRMLILDDSEFRPLSEWVDYAVDRHQNQIKPWIESATFEFESYIDQGLEWGEKPSETSEKKTKQEKKPDKSVFTKLKNAVFEEPAHEPGKKSERLDFKLEESTIQEMRAAPDETSRRKAEIQEVLMTETLSGDSDPARRVGLWRNLAQIYEVLKDERESALAWAHALWVVPEDSMNEISALWTSGRSGENSRSIELVDSLLKKDEIDARQLRDLAALILNLGPEDLDKERQEKLSLWLAARDELLDLRTLWLIHRRLARLSGGDLLKLSRVRDRILESLRYGLSLGRDVPAFVRMSNGPELSERADAGSLLSEELDFHLEQFNKTKRKRSALDTQPTKTAAYVHLIFAYCQAKLGQREKAEKLESVGIKELQGADPVHDLLLKGFLIRGRQVLEGIPLTAPMEPGWLTELEALERLDRYKVDRLRQASTVLDHRAHLDPMLLFRLNRRDARGQEFEILHKPLGAEERAKLMEEILKRVSTPGETEENQAEFLRGLLEHLPLLPPEYGLPFMRDIQKQSVKLSPAGRIPVYEEVIQCSAFYHNVEFAGEIIRDLGENLENLDADSSRSLADSLGKLMGALRQLELTAPTLEITQKLLKHLKADNFESLLARVRVSACLAELEETDTTRETLDLAMERLKSDLSPTERLKLTRSVARTASFLPQEEALERIRILSKQLSLIADSYNTNSHFCLSVLDFMETIGLGLAGEQLVLGRDGRRWMEIEEDSIRRRINHDLENL